MTLDEARKWYEKIEACAADDESAHSEEDDFREAVLRAVADGCADAKALAKVTLSTSDIRFNRLCA